MKKRMTMILAAILTTCMAFAQNVLVTPPEEATVEQWGMTYDEYDENDNISHMTDVAKVAFVGDDVYIAGLAINGAWVKGTVNGDKVLIPQGQYVGSMDDYLFYLRGFDGSQSGVDIVFDYDKEEGKLTSANDIILVTANDDIMGHTTNVVINKGGGVEPSEGQWTLTGKNVNPSNESQYNEMNDPIDITIEGDKVSVYGFGLDESSVLRGTISGTTVTFPKGQSAGFYEQTELFYVGFAGESEIDIVFDYDAAHGTMTAQSWILAIDASGNTYILLKDVVFKQGTVTPVEPQEDPLVEVPNGLQTTDYLFKASSINYDSDGSVAGMEQVEYNVRVGFQGNDVYIQGLYQGMPLAWVKGTKNTDGDYVFKSGQYYGAHPQFTTMKFYFCGQIFGQMSDVEMEYDSSTRTLKGGSYYIMVNSTKNTMAPYYVFAGVTITKIAEKAAVPADPSVTEYAAYNSQYGYGYVCFDIPVKDIDGNAIVRDKLYYKMYVKKGDQEEAYIFTPGLYKNLTSDMSLVPYLYSDGYDFMYGGTQVCFYQESENWDKIGVQSVYAGGFVNKTSNICWYDIKTGGTESAISDIEQNVEETTYSDLQGRKASSSTRGLVIKTERMADGTLRSVKVLR